VGIVITKKVAIFIIITIDIQSILSSSSPKKRIKDRAQLKKNVETIMMKNMAHTEAQKYVHYIFQKNLDIYSGDNYMPNNVQ
ncbi:hypothetical protein PFFCH_05175, partial [Plasmodium falciparum FCH/4]